MDHTCTIAGQRQHTEKSLIVHHSVEVRVVVVVHIELDVRAFAPRAPDVKVEVVVVFRGDFEPLHSVTQHRINC